MSNEDILVGMKAIAGFLKVSEKVVRRWMVECPELPIVKDGQLLANARDLSEWQRERIKTLRLQGAVKKTLSTFNNG
jgi:hypothetical protein